MDSTHCTGWALKDNSENRVWEEGVDLGGIRKRSKYHQNTLYEILDELIKNENKNNLALRSQDQKFKANSRLLAHF